MKTFRRLSAAVAFAAGRSYVRVQIGDDRIYIVADEGEEISPHDSVEFVTSRNDRGQAEIAGHVGFGHLDRLGNANSAAAAPGEYLRRKEFPIERRRGLCHAFQDPAEAAVFAADKDVFLGAARGAYTKREAPVALDAWKDRAGYAWSDLGDGEAQRAIRDKVRAAKDAIEFAADRAAGLVAAADRDAAQEAAFQRFDQARTVARSSNRDRYSDVDPRDLDPATGAPAAGYSSPSLDDSFHRGEMDVD